MELLWIDYTKKDGTSRYILFLSLGKKPGKLCGLDTTQVPDNFKRKLIADMPQLSLESRIAWLKHNYPALMKTAYRELIADRARIRNLYKI